MASPNELYVSDLDGTLFNSNKKLSPYTVEVLNRCIKKGMLFAVATARMPYGCDYRLEDIHFNIPSILTNGVFLYDFSRKEFIAAETISWESAKNVLDCFRKAGTGCFLYTFCDNKINLYYNDPDLEQQTQYYSDRALKCCGEVLYTNSLESKLKSNNTVYFALTGEEAQIKTIASFVTNIEGVSCSAYLNIYNGLYCLEVFSSNASKRNALQRLKILTGTENLIVFGDNYNDISMIEIAQRSYCPANAVEPVKQMVTNVLENCDQDGVAKFLAKEWNVE